MAKRMSEVMAAAALVLAGYCVRGATGCGTASAGEEEPEVVATVKCVEGAIPSNGTATLKFAGKSKEWIATNVIPIKLSFNGSATLVAAMDLVDGSAVALCAPGQSVEFLQR